MGTTTVSFKVAMDAEQKFAKNFQTVKFECNFEGVPASIIQRHAIANQVVAWQGQIRNNWDKFLAGNLPKVVTFGVPLFEGKRTVTRPPTEEEVKAYTRARLATMTPEEIQVFIETGAMPEEVPAKEVDEDGDEVITVDTEEEEEF